MTTLKGMITRQELKDALGIGETALCRWVKQGKVPAPVRIGKCTYWFDDAIEKTMDTLRRRSEKNLRR